MTGATRGSSGEKIWWKLSFEFLQQLLWYRKLCSFCQILKNESPRYLFNIIPTKNSSYLLKLQGTTSVFYCLKETIVSNVIIYNGQNIWDNLKFLCGSAHYGKCSMCFFKSVLLVVTKFSFWGDWLYSISYWDLLDIS